MNNYLTIWDAILLPLYLIIIYMIAFNIKTNQINKHPEYAYFVKGLSFKIVGALSFIMIYLFYYKGGDTINYYRGTVALFNLLVENFQIGFSILMNNLTPENFSAFNYKTGWPPMYMWKGEETFSVIRYSVIPLLLGAKSILITNLITSCFSYIGIWKIFRLFVDQYPQYKKILTYSILFIPSVSFWGGGIMKDTYVLGATCWITCNFYQILIARQKIITNLILFFINFFIIVNLKPYIIISLVPGMLLWLYSAYLNKIENMILKTMLLPLIVILVSTMGIYLFQNIGVLLGDYNNLDNVLEKARITQQDLLREDSYGSNNYNIGRIEGSTSGLLKKAPLAIFTAIYRPAIIEIGSPTMFLSVVENTILLVITIIILLRTKIKLLFNLFKKNPLIVYAITFSIILAFGVGIATANFGALVRYKIPLIPFYFSSIFILNEKRKEEQRKLIPS